MSVSNAPWHNVHIGRDYYVNSPETRQALGLRHLDREYVMGDESSPFIMHDYLRGIFIFLTDLPKGAKVED